MNQPWDHPYLGANSVGRASGSCSEERVSLMTMDSQLGSTGGRWLYMGEMHVHMLLSTYILVYILLYIIAHTLYIIYKLCI